MLSDLCTVKYKIQEFDICNHVVDFFSCPLFTFFEYVVVWYFWKKIQLFLKCYWQNLKTIKTIRSNLLGNIIVCGEPMLVTFVVNPCPLIYIPKNVYTCSNICLMFIKIIPTYYQQNYVPTSQQACSRSYLRTMRCPKYILGYVLTLSMFFEDLLTLGTAICSYLRASLTLSLDHPKAEKNHVFGDIGTFVKLFL